nr:hypothetical protein [uncultured archaeon]
MIQDAYKLDLINMYMFVHEDYKPNLKDISETYRSLKYDTRFVTK